jgi:hypothetical protein
MQTIQDGSAPGDLSVVVPATANALVGPIVDAEWISVQISGVFTGTFTFEQSNDGVNWVPLPLANASATTATAQVTTATAVGLWHGPVPAEHVRVRRSTAGTGTPTVSVLAYSLPLALASLPSDPGTVNGTTATTSLTAVTTATAGTALNVGTARTKHALHVTGGGTTWACVLEGTLDGTAWFTLGTLDNTNPSGGYLAVIDRPVLQIRARTTSNPNAALTARIVSAS